MEKSDLIIFDNFGSQPFGQNLKFTLLQLLDKNIRSHYHPENESRLPVIKNNDVRKENH